MLNCENMNLPEILKPFENQLESILVYAKGQNFDFNNMTKETLDALMLGWIKMTKKLTEDITENIDLVLPMIKKQVLK